MSICARRDIYTIQPKQSRPNRAEILHTLHFQLDILTRSTTPPPQIPNHNSSLCRLVSLNKPCLLFDPPHNREHLIAQRNRIFLIQLQLGKLGPDISPSLCFQKLHLSTPNAGTASPQSLPGSQVRAAMSSTAVPLPALTSKSCKMRGPAMLSQSRTPQSRVCRESPLTMGVFWFSDLTPPSRAFLMIHMP